MTEQRLFETPLGSFEVERYPAPEPNLFAWNAGDSLALSWLSEAGHQNFDRCLVVNDSFGALAVGLGGKGVVSWNDSYLAHSGLRANLARNGFDPESVEALASTETPSGHFDLVIVQVPKSTKSLMDQLRQIRPVVSDETIVVGAGMTRNIHKSTISCFETTIGPATTSLARRKARLIHPVYEQSIEINSVTKRNEFVERGLTLVSYPGIFSAGRLDRGSSLLLDVLDKMALDGASLDLGCGNGVVGASILRSNDNSEVTFVDESYLAVESAKETVAVNGLSGASFAVDDAGSSLESDSFDHIIINPPFHDRAAQSLRTSGAMFESAKRLIRSGGEVIVVGNRHLGHHRALKALFGNCETLKTNSKFLVMRSVA